MSHWKEKHSAIASVYLVLRRGDEVLLLLRKNTGYCDGQYGLPAGHVDGNETLHQAIIREAKEEAGISLVQQDLDLIHVMHRNCGDHERVDFFFEAYSWEGEPKNVEPHKCEVLQWYRIDALPENVIDYYRHMFENVGKKISISYFGWE